MTACVVFGGTRGIGAAIAKRLYRDGFHVVVVSRNQDNISKCTESFSSLSSDNNKILGLACDVTDEEKVSATLAQVTESVGPISVLVNAAGINEDQLLVKSSAENIRHLLDVNLVGSMVTCKAAVRGMMQRRAGCIINIGSIIGSKGNAGQCAYSASKAGLEGFTKSLAKEVASRGIRVNCINPGYIRTDMTAALEQNTRLLSRIPLGRMGEPDEVADLARFLVDATYITGQSLFVDGGLQINS